MGSSLISSIIVGRGDQVPFIRAESDHSLETCLAIKRHTSLSYQRLSVIQVAVWCEPLKQKSLQLVSTTSLVSEAP